MVPATVTGTSSTLTGGAKAQRQAHPWECATGLWTILGMTLGPALALGRGLKRGKRDFRRGAGTTPGRVQVERGQL